MTESAALTTDDDRLHGSAILDKVKEIDSFVRKHAQQVQTTRRLSTPVGDAVRRMHQAPAR